MSTYIESKPLSLLEKKKQQWAKEREELDGLCTPWGSKQDGFYDRHFERNEISTKLSIITNNSLRKDLTSPRRSSLPPLYKNQYNTLDKFERERELGGETSGYGSEDHSPAEYTVLPTWNHSTGYDSSSSCRDDRLKWSDTRLPPTYWENKKELAKTEPPNWVKRGLETGDEIVVSNTSPAVSPEQDYGEQDRPSTGSTTSNTNKTYIRGQNIPLDSYELAERERKRQIALAHQEAIRQQLEERERKRDEERQKRILEEREEELRMEQQQEVERKRQEKEQQLLKEKQQREEKRKEAIQEAIEIAEKEAKMAKMRNRHSHNEENDKNLMNNEEQCAKTKVPNNPNIVINNDLQIENKAKKIEEKNLVTPKNKELNCTEAKVLNTPRPQPSTSASTESIFPSNDLPTPNPSLPKSQSENLAMLLQQPNFEHLPQHYQYAVLLPTSATPSLPFAIPIAISNEDEHSTTRTENRILTPSIYRIKNRKVQDSCTQTEPSDFPTTPEFETSRDKYTSSRDKSENETRRKNGRRSRSESVAEDRPKWGANRPPTRYVKQSDKDPLYLRRKLRQKREKYEEKNSSDDSQTNTPRFRNKKGYNDKRHSRPTWRKHDLFSNSVRHYQTEIYSLEADKNNIYYDHKCCCSCKCCVKKDKEGSPRNTHSSSFEKLPATISQHSERLVQTNMLQKQSEWDTSLPSLSQSSRNLD